MRTRTMKPLFLIFCLCLSPLLMGQNQNKIQEAMANYDYETAVELINKEPPTITVDAESKSPERKSAAMRKLYAPSAK